MTATNALGVIDQNAHSDAMHEKYAFAAMIRPAQRVSRDFKHAYRMRALQLHERNGPLERLLRFSRGFEDPLPDARVFRLITTS
jgi:hypothetical protein